MNSRRKRATWNTRMPLFLSIVALCLLVGGISAWGMNARISGAVLGNGSVVASTTQQAIQHEKGGVVDVINIRGGDRVQAGDVLVTLDASLLQAELEGIEAELLEMLTQEARLKAEIHGGFSLEPDPLLASLFGTHPSYGISIQRQQAELDANRLTLEKKKSVLLQQVAQVRNRQIGLDGQLRVKREQLDTARAEYARIRDLINRRLAVVQRAVTAHRDMSALAAEVARLEAQQAETSARLNELRLQMETLPSEAHAKALSELNRVQPLKAKLQQRRSATRETLGNMDIKAPIDGTVHDLRLQGPRSVVRAGQPILFIVPNATPVLAQIRIDARDIEDVFVGQKAALRFPAFNKRSTPMVDGRVLGRSADSFLDTKKNTYYYNVEIEIDRNSLAALGDKELVSGMPVEAFITTEERSPVTYMMRPITVYFEKAFRDS